MATLSPDLTQYDTAFHTGFLEALQDFSEAFSQRSNGAIVVRSEALPGDYSRQSIYTALGSVVHRDITSSAAAPTQPVVDADAVAVKTAWRFGPVDFSREAVVRKGQTIEQIELLAGRRAAESATQYQLDCAIAAITGATAGQTDVQATGSWSSDGKKLLTKALRRFGDRASELRLWIMSSASFFDLVDTAITEQLFGEVGTVVYGGQPGTLGLPVLVSDRCPDDLIFGLRAGAIEVIESQPPQYLRQSVAGGNNLVERIQAEGTINIAVYGYRWAPATAILNPDPTQLAAGANWARWSGAKTSAGVVIQVTP